MQAVSRVERNSLHVFYFAKKKLKIIFKGGIKNESASKGFEAESIS